MPVSLHPVTVAHAPLARSELRVTAHLSSMSMYAVIDLVDLVEIEHQQALDAECTVACPDCEQGLSPDLGLGLSICQRCDGTATIADSSRAA